MSDGDRRVWVGVGSVLLLLGGVAVVRIVGQVRGPVAPPGVVADVPPPVIPLHAPSVEAPPPMTYPEVPAITECRALLDKVVRGHALDPENPWAVEHGLISLGSDATLTNGKPAIDYLFEEYAEPVDVLGASLIRFPVKRDRPGQPEIRIEPHTDLILSGLAQLGVPPDRPVIVKGQPHTVADLYRHSLWRTWVVGDQVSATSWDDTPWTLIALTAYSPPGLKWVAEGGHPMTMDGYTHTVVRKLHDETQFLRDAIVNRTAVKKQKQGIFSYTCGGAHLLQGAAYAVARGFGEPGDRHSIEDEIPVLYSRYAIEMAAVDNALKTNPEYTNVLLAQRLKFLGHFLESAQRLSALGFYRPDADQAEILKAATGETCATVMVLQKSGVLDHLDEIRPKNEQFYLDITGDSAHALRGLDYMMGRRTVLY